MYRFLRYAVSCIIAQGFQLNPEACIECRKAPHCITAFCTRDELFSKELSSHESGDHLYTFSVCLARCERLMQHRGYMSSRIMRDGRCPGMTTCKSCIAIMQVCLCMHATTLGYWLSLSSICCKPCELCFCV